MANASDLCVKSKVKEAIKTQDLNCAGDVFDALDSVLNQVLNQGAARARANGRKTIKGHDIHA